MSSVAKDIAIVGGGIVGLATAMLLARRSRASIVLLEAESALAAHQSGHNSGVIHSGLYYAPGSRKARNCLEGREALLRFCQEQGIAQEGCGKLVLASTAAELPALERLGRRGVENGLQGLRQLSAAEMVEVEPHVVGVAGLWVPQTGIVDFRQVAQAYARLAAADGVEIRTAARVRAVARGAGELILQGSGEEIRCRHLINCGGLHSDRLARICGLSPGLQILPFRGEYYELLPARRNLVRNLIYPVPDPRFPFLGVHFTRRIDGAIEAGPNAVLALARHGYNWRDFSPVDLAEMLRYRGFWRMASRYWRTGMAEVSRSLSKAHFVRDLQMLIPSLQPGDLRRAGSGVRAMAVEPDGRLVDDFRIVQADRMIHVLNAPSPAATASLSIAREIVEMAQASFSIPSR